MSVGKRSTPVQKIVDFITWGEIWKNLALSMNNFLINSRNHCVEVVVRFSFILCIYLLAKKFPEMAAHLGEKRNSLAQDWKTKGIFLGKEFTFSFFFLAQRVFQITDRNVIRLETWNMNSCALFYDQHCPHFSVTILNVMGWLARKPFSI